MGAGERGSGAGGAARRIGCGGGERHSLLLLLLPPSLLAVIRIISLSPLPTTPPVLASPSYPSHAASQIYSTHQLVHGLEIVHGRYLKTTYLYEHYG